jgi:hypothetical protein
VALILLVLGTIGVGVIAVSLWPTLGAATSGGTGALRPATARVLESAPCGAATGGDLVEVTVGGQPKRGRFDGCGHTPGQQLRVQVPVDPASELVVKPESLTASASGQASGTRDRLSWVLLTLAGIAGGGFMLLLRSRSV